MRILLATLALLFGLTTAHAQIAGQNDPQFKAALALWLEGNDDLAALTALSELAKADNRAAQVFLGRVNEATHTHIHVTGPMERKARIALMRQVGGMSGKSWLKAASEDVPLAVAFLQSKVILEKPAAIEALLDFNEIAAALISMLGLLYSWEYESVLQLSKHPNLPDHASYLRTNAVLSLAIRKAINAGQRSARSLNRLQQKADRILTANSKFLWEGYHRDDVEVGQPSRMIPDAFPESMINSLFYAPLKTLCSERCGSDVPNCMHAIMIHQSGTTPIWITLASPVETLLPSSEYHNSPRMLDDLVRLIRMPTNVSLEYVKRLDQCAYESVFAE